MPCLLGYKISRIAYLNYLQTTHEDGRASCFFSLFLNSSVERLSFEGYSKGSYLGIRLNLFHGKLSVREEGAMYFLSLHYMGKNSS